MQGSNFQLILLTAFGFFAVIAVIIFSGILPISSTGGTKLSGNVVIWGTVKESALKPIIDQISLDNKDIRTVYVQKSPATFDKEFIEALASGKGPDLFLLPQDLIIKYQDKIFTIPYSNLSARDFKNVFIQESELYLTKDGALGLPLTIDPMVMYWNRDIFSSASISKPPEFWDEFITIAPKINKYDNAKNILVSTVGLGEYKNISYAKDILANLMLQVGNNIIVRNADDTLSSTFLSTMSDKNGSIKPSESVFRFFTEFSDPAKPIYSWNRSLPQTKQNFISEKLAVYFGYSSEILELRSKNPHLNFDVAAMPQTRDSSTKINFGKMQAIAITKASKNIPTAYFIASLITNNVNSAAISKNLYLPPARRDLLSVKPQDPYLEIFYNNALTSRGWLDPSPASTDKIFNDAIDSIISGKSRVAEAVSVLGDELIKTTE